MFEAVPGVSFSMPHSMLHSHIATQVVVSHTGSSHRQCTPVFDFMKHFADAPSRNANSLLLNKVLLQHSLEHPAQQQQLNMS